ncbi:MAG: zincin-like metallopeptidase domain-containing protein [bacterium]|nr:zincin-like metallopeptidase domain-containing protein [bacterium]
MSSKAKQDVYQKVTDRIIAGLETKGLKWFRPWTGGAVGGMLPVNNATGKAYKGLNVLFLSIEQAVQGYAHNEWLTFKQAIGQGGVVRKGEKGTEIVFWNINWRGENGKFYRKFEDVPAGMAADKVFSPRVWNVFNIAQCDDIAPLAAAEPTEAVKEFTPIEAAERVYNVQYPEANRPTLSHGGGSAYYTPARHHVQMPKREKFVTSDDYYATLFHELVHSTGHKDILNRLSKTAAFGSEDYSKEELVAEIGSQFLVSLTGLDPKNDETNSQAYINTWISKLKEQPRMALSAANQAMKAIDFITGDH